MKRNMKVSIVTILALVCLSLAFAYQPSFAEKSSSPDELVMKYIDMMLHEEYEKASSLFDSAAGYDPDVNSTVAYKNNWINKVEEPNSEESDLRKLLIKQRSFVINCFGTEAWEKVSYRLEVIPSQEKKEKFILRESGKEITKEEYDKVNHAFWSKYATERGIDPESFFTPKDKDRVNILTEKGKNVSEPAVVELVDKYEQYAVFFSFCGESTSATSEYGFYFHIYNRSGFWIISSPLKWQTPAINEELSGD